jgi:hypothetical protein
MGCELRRGVHPGHRGRIHRHREEDEEGAGARGADHEGQLQGRRGRQGGPGLLAVDNRASKKKKLLLYRFRVKSTAAEPAA